MPPRNDRRRPPHLVRHSLPVWWPEDVWRQDVPPLPLPQRCLVSGYVYVKNWDRFQRYKDRRPPWIKLAGALLDDDRYLSLSLADRGLLQDLWKLASMSGDGRVSADRTSLARRLNVRRVSLEPLIQAGWIEVRAQRAHTPRTPDARLEAETEEEADKGLDRSINRSSRGGARPVVEDRAIKNSKHAATLAACRRLAHQYAEAGEPPERIREWLTNEYRHDPSIVTEALGAP